MVLHGRGISNANVWRGDFYMRPDRFGNGIGTHATLPRAVQPAVRVTALQPALQ